MSGRSIKFSSCTSECQEKMAIVEVIISKYNTTSISTRKMVLDHTFLDTCIWIFMIYISSVNPCIQQMSYKEGMTYNTSCSYLTLFFSYLIFFFYILCCLILWRHKYRLVCTGQFIYLCPWLRYNFIFIFISTQEPDNTYTFQAFALINSKYFLI